MESLIYIVEDDEGIRELYEGAFEGLYMTKMFENGKDFFECFESARPSLVILDIMLPRYGRIYDPFENQRNG